MTELYQYFLPSSEVCSLQQVISLFGSKPELEVTAAAAAKGLPGKGKDRGNLGGTKGITPGKGSPGIPAGRAPGKPGRADKGAVIGKRGGRIGGIPPKVGGMVIPGINPAEGTMGKDAFKLDKFGAIGILTDAFTGTDEATGTALSFEAIFNIFNDEKEKRIAVNDEGAESREKKNSKFYSAAY